MIVGASRSRANKKVADFFLFSQIGRFVKTNGCECIDMKIMHHFYLE